MDPSFLENAWDLILFREQVVVDSGKEFQSDVDVGLGFRGGPEPVE